MIRGELEALDLVRLYDEDERFRAAVDTDTSGFTDEDGVYFPGPTLGWTRKVARVIDAYEGAA